jgi:hypothetical protein
MIKAFRGACRRPGPGGRRYPALSAFFFNLRAGRCPRTLSFRFFHPPTPVLTPYPPTKKHTLQATCARLCNCAWTACAGRGKKRCVGGAREKKAAATRARAHGRPPIFFPSWLRHQAAGGRALFLCRDPARRSSSHRLPSRAHAGEGGPGPGPPPATSHSRGGPCVPGRPDTPAETRTHALTHFCCSPPLFLYRADCQH